MENLDINNFKLFLVKSGYLKQDNWNQKNSDILDSGEVNDILLSFEYNEKISIKQASKKYADKIQWVNKIFNIHFTLEELHFQYINYTSTNIPLICFLNNLIMIEIILKSFDNIINQNNEQNITDIFPEQIIMNDIDLYSSSNNNNILGIKQKLEFIYEKLKNKPFFDKKKVNGDLICLIFLTSLGSTFSVDKNIPKIKNLINLFCVYNKVYLNDVNISLILYLNVIICINLFIYSNRKRYHFDFLSYDEFYPYNHYYQEFKKKNGYEKYTMNESPNEDLNEHINLFLFDNDAIKYGGDDFSEILLFQNCLKIFSIYHLSKNNIKLTVYLTIDTIIEILKSFNDTISINKTNNIQNINFNINIHNKTTINKIKLTDLFILTKNNINKCFSSFNFYELLIKVTNFQTESQIQEINTKFAELISKSQKFYLQNSISALQNNINNDNNIQIETDQKTEESNTPIDYLKKEFNVLYYLLLYYIKNKEIKKNLVFYSFKFRFFKCSIFRESKKDIQLFFDYSSIKERYLLRYLKDIENLLLLIKLYQEIINTINEFKLYNITLRITQTNFRSRHINFFFTIIIKKLDYYIQENKFNRITLYDAKIKTYQENMVVYIKDNSIKEKVRINSLKEMINLSRFNNKLKILNAYVKEMAEDWDIIIIGQNIKYHNLMYSKNINILFLNITKEENDNFVQNLLPGSDIIYDSIKDMNPYTSTKIQSDSHEYKFLNIFMYIIKNEDFAEKVLNFAEKLKENEDSILTNKITFVCERFFFEEKIMMNSRIKENSKQIYNCIDNYFLVCDTKKEGEIYKYDLYISLHYISLVNYLSFEVTQNFLELINTFITVFSSCVELILYIYDKKENETSGPKKFYYIQKIKKDYYLFEYKKTNIFVKILRNFESLLLLNPKKTIPLLCLLAKESTNKYIANTDNFLDLFLRLFLNLHKVVDINELNETFFEKIHKNIFYQNYDRFTIMSFSYDAFFVFNELFINNNFLNISENNKFEICHIIPYEVDLSTKSNYVKKIITNKNNLIVKNIKIYDYNFSNSFLFNNSNELKMNYKKANYFLEFHNTTNDAINSINAKIRFFYKKLKDKKFQKDKIKKILNIFKEFYYEKDNIIFYSGNEKNLSKFMKAYNNHEITIKTSKVLVDFQS